MRERERERGTSLLFGDKSYWSNIAASSLSHGVLALVTFIFFTTRFKDSKLTIGVRLQSTFIIAYVQQII